MDMDNSIIFVHLRILLTLAIVCPNQTQGNKE